MTDENTLTEDSNETTAIISPENSHFVVAKQDKRIVSTIFDVCFIPATQDIDFSLFTEAEIKAISSGDAPWASTKIKKPYWAREYDELDIGIYGAIGNDNDRHLLDFIIAAGYPLTPKKVRQATLREILWSWENRNATDSGKPCEFDSVTPEYRDENLPATIIKGSLSPNTLRSLDDAIFSDSYVYVVFEVSTILKLLGKSDGMNNKNKLKKDLDKMALIEFRVTPLVKGGSNVNLDPLKFKLLATNFYAFFDATNTRNKKSLTKDSYNHVLVGIGRDYYSSLSQDGTIPREKLITKFIGLKNKSHIIDFIKFLESNQDGFFKNRNLKKLIKLYFDNKIVLVKEQNKKRIITNRVNATFKSVTEPHAHERLTQITGYTIIGAGNEAKLIYIRNNQN